ncbi:MAG: ketosteroid isomerase [Ilumatobacteraceae bacterium]
MPDEIPESLTDAETHAFADTFIAAILAADVDAVIAMYAPGATIWHNFDNVDQTPQENARTLKAMHRILPGFHYDEIRRTVLPDGFWQQHVLRAPTASGEFAMAAALKITIERGLITRLEEYLDPAPFVALVAG